MGDANGSYAAVNGHTTHIDKMNGTTHREDLSPKTTPIAIVGVGCRFGGGVTSPEKLWDLLAQGESTWSEIPPQRYNKEAFYHPDAQKSGASNVRGGYWLQEDVTRFDPSFFNFSAEAAAAMDPQLRLQLEVTYEALESAGVSLSDIAGSNTSVFSGTFVRDYHDLLMRDPLTLPRYFMTGNFMAMAANRISHFFDLRGPSTPVDTGCSTSLTALHLACQTLRNGESDTAIAGGVCVMLNPDMFAQMSSLGFIGPDGKSFSFDHRAQGYGRGEGVAAVVLKRLDDALRDGDPIRAVIRETGMNQDGKTPTITSPSGEAQEALMRACYERSGLSPKDTTYVEAHGTGTKTGDPIEVAAIGAVFGNVRPSDQPLLIGSVKSNLGHTEAASGLAAIIKVVKAFENGQIPPSVNFERENPVLNLDSWNLKISRGLEPWESPNGRRASVNNFGYGGSNTHVILDDALGYIKKYHNSNPSSTEQLPQRKVFLVSARDEDVAKKMVSNLQEYLRAAVAVKKDVDLPNLAYTLGQRRSRFQWITAFSAESIQEMDECLAEKTFNPVYSSSPLKLGFVFTGQGAQWHAMGRELMVAYPVFMRTIQESDAILKEFGAEWSCVEELTRDASTTRVNQVSFSFPLSCVIQLALVRLMATWGIHPSAVTGHSSGEIAAAYAAGVLDFREALAIVYFRGLLTGKYVQKATTRGGMLAVGLGSNAVQPYLEKVLSGSVVTACINSPSSVTLSGDLTAIEELEKALNANGIFARRLKVESAYHSHHMLPIEKDYKDALDTHLRKFRTFDNVIFSSPVSGEPVDDPNELGSSHWVANMLQPVLFDQCLRNMCVSSTGSPNVNMLIEVGPHGSLAGPIRQCLGEPDLKKLGLTYGSCLNRGQDAIHTMQNLAATLMTKGYPVSLAEVNFPSGSDGLRAIGELPSYPWNHTQTFWAEPRASREHRFREHQYHDLLGARVPGIAPHLTIWRHLLRPAEIPWVRDHLVQSDIVYPAAGCIAMAIEGIRQLFQTTGKIIQGYILREVEITRALVIPDTSDGVEAQLLLEPSDETSLMQDLRAFHIYSATPDGDWVEHCRGLVGVNAEESAATKTGQLQSTVDIDFNASSGAYFRAIHPNDLFQSLRTAGVNHGPLFQNLLSVRAGSQKSVTAFEVANMTAVMPGKHQAEHVIHPVTLDAVFQGAYAAMSMDAQRTVGAAVPRSIKKMYISEQISRDAGHRFQSYANLHGYNSQGFDTSMALVSNSQDSLSIPLVEIEGMYYQSLGLSEDEETEDSALCLTTDWKEDIDLCKLDDLRTRLKRPVDSDEKLIGEELTRATYHLVHDTLEALTEKELAGLQGHHQKFLTWMRDIEDKAARNELGPRSSRWVKASDGVKEMLYDRVSSQSVNGQLLCRIGRALSTILRKEIAPIDLMMEGQLLHRFYENMLRLTRSIAQAVELVELYSHRNPRAKIIEIGAGTGAFTEPLLRTLGGHIPGSTARFANYTFTDVSSDFLALAKEKFSAWGGLVTCQELDIEQDPGQQSFELRSYDVVVASLVFATTKDIRNTMTNVRRLLRDGGKLVLVESTKVSVDVNLIFGSLPDWWLCKEPERGYSPNLTVSMWKEVLQETGFSGLDLEVRDCEDEEHYSMSVIASTAVSSKTPMFDDRIALVHSDSMPPPSEWMEMLKTRLADITHSDVTVENLHSLDPRDKVVIFLSEIATPILSRMDDVDFAAIKGTLIQSRGIFWITRGSALDCDIPESSLHTGLLRTRRVEDSKRYIALDLDPKNEPWATSAIPVITNVFQAAFDIGKEADSVDFEYAERSGLILIPRVRFDATQSEITTHSRRSVVALQPFHQPNRELRMLVRTPGLLDSLVFTDDPAAEEELPADYVEIEPQAFGLNFRDVMVALGQLEEKTMGFECSGLVTRVGPGAAHKFQVGDRVCALTSHGHWANHSRVPWTSVARIPDSMSFETAASIPMVFLTAYYALFEAARLEEGESVLIHAASGGVGQATITLAKWKKARIFATVGSREKKEFLINTYGIPESHIFSSRNVSFATAVKAATGGKGVDVVVNSLAGKLLHETWNSLAPYGRFVEVGKKDIQLNKRLEMDPFRHAVSFMAFDLVHLSDYRALTVSRMLHAIIELLDQQAITTVRPLTVYPISDIGRAFRLMQGGKHIGKMILRANPGDMVNVMASTKPARLSADVSYLLVGGLGGIGQSIAWWFVEHGAKHLILLSRSAASRSDSKIVVEQLRSAGCNVVVQNCDVSNPADLAKTLDSCSQRMPPVRGVIQGAMVLKDSIFERMTFDQWQGAILPKVRASWNLHKYFKSSLDFFVMLSSVTGIAGNPSQSNYASGNTYLDALARFRSARGLPAVSLDLGMVKSVGYVAENKSVAERLLREGLRPLEEEEVLQLIEVAIKNPLRATSSCQVITGIAGFEADAKGGWRQDPRFANLQKHDTVVGQAAGGSSSQHGGFNLKESIANAASVEEATGLISRAIAGKLSEMFVIPETDIDEQMPLSKYGVDSLVAVELRNWLVAQTRSEMSIFDVLGSPSLLGLAQKIAQRSK